MCALFLAILLSHLQQLVLRRGQGQGQGQPGPGPVSGISHSYWQKDFNLFKAFCVVLLLYLCLSLCVRVLLSFGAQLYLQRSPAAKGCDCGWGLLQVRSATLAPKNENALLTICENRLRFQIRCVISNENAFQFAAKPRTARSDVDVSVGTAIGHKQWEYECKHGEGGEKIDVLLLLNINSNISTRLGINAVMWVWERGEIYVVCM